MHQLLSAVLIALTFGAASSAVEPEVSIVGTWKIVRYERP